ncbi:hypothetical protein [Pedobacter cryoconitis]|uniref:Uncharacterized protein n=1 Tax=Pedobacter cryoconitis TaxID=188932 RepID=A0A327SJX7_9SPHI|nr:hypothetical protein [Pedobacter cryoconitis]RAJ26047.1 hypothetical protein LY11_03980 [Pedobacter cryoconitis]
MIEPYYQVEFTAIACKFEININEINLISLAIENQASTLIPLNSGIAKTGEQKLNVKLLALPGQEFLNPQAVFSYKIKVYEMKYGFELKTTIEGHAFPPVDPSKKLKVMSHDQIFNAEVPYTIDVWQKGTLLTDVDDLDEKLKRAYSRIASHIRNKEYEKLKMELANREKTMATSMYLSKEDSEARLNSLVKDIEDGFTVMPMDPTVLITISGQGRLAAYKKLSGEPALTLFNPKTGEEIMLDLSFYIPAGKTEFVVI